MKKTAGANSDAPTPPKTPEIEPATVLVTTPEPEKLTTGDVKALTGDDGSEAPENSANADAADALKQAKAAAKAAAKNPDSVDRAYFHGQGGAAGI